MSGNQLPKHLEAFLESGQICVVYQNAPAGSLIKSNFHQNLAVRSDLPLWAPRDHNPTVQRGVERLYKQDTKIRLQIPGEANNTAKALP